MRRDKLIKLTLICTLVGLTLWVVATALRIGSFERKTWRLGLDLQGGTHLLYEADLSEIPSDQQQLRVEQAKNIIEKRVNAYGVTEPVIQIQGNNLISVQLPGFTDIDEAEKLIGTTAELDFRKLATSADGGLTTLATEATEGDTSLTVVDASNFTIGSSIRVKSGLIISDYIIETIDTDNNNITISTEASTAYPAGADVTQWIPAIGIIGEETIHLTGEFFEANATPMFAQQGATDVVVVFSLDEDTNGPTLFGQITGDLIGKPLGIFMDNEKISAPTVQEQLTTGGQITGLDINEARLLAIQLNQGALPLTLEPKSQQLVSATLGADSLRKSLWAGGIGLTLVLIFMIAYYRLPGLLASLALIIYVLTVLSIFKLVPVTLTLAGIAAFVLSIGMAVDANVLIFERMREEIRFGRTIGASIESGFDRAWSSIRDSNISTIITCIVLFFFGRALGATVVMGFAITLLIGVLMSMFTAIVITKTFLRTFVGTRFAKKISLFYSGSRGHHTNV